MGQDMGQDTGDPLQALLGQQIKERFPDGSIDRVELLRYGDDPEIEPGKLLVRIHVHAPGEPARMTIRWMTGSTRTGR